MNLLLAIPIGVFFAVLIVSLAMKDGRLKFLDNPISFGRRGASQKIPERNYEPYAPRKYENLTLFSFGLLVLIIAYHLSQYLLLCFLYGVHRVQSEGLHFTDMSKGSSWIVSNGDRIDHSSHPLLFVIGAVVWIVPTFVGFIAIRRYLPKRNPPGASHIGHSDAQAHLMQKPMERRSLAEKDRSLRVHSLLFLACWVFATATLFVFAHVIGRMVLVLIPGISIILYIIYVRFRAQRFAAMVMTTPCPQCGQRPMRYQAPRDENGNQHSLICDQCRVEWKLGPV